MDLNIKSGVKEYILNGANGAYTLRFNPTDGGFAEDIINALDTLDKIEEKYSDLIKNEQNGNKVFSLGREKDTEERAILDSVLGDGACETLFGRIRVYSGDGEGFPLWLSLLTMLIDEMSAAFEMEKKETNPRLEKYLQKYKK